MDTQTQLFCFAGKLHYFIDRINNFCREHILNNIIKNFPSFIAFSHTKYDIRIIFNKI